IVTVLGVDDRVPSVTVSVKVRSPSVAGVVKDGFGVFAFWSVTVVPDVCCHWNVSGPPLEWETEALRETGVRFDVGMSGPALAAQWSRQRRGNRRHWCAVLHGDHDRRGGRAHLAIVDDQRECQRTGDAWGGERRLRARDTAEDDRSSTGLSPRKRQRMTAGV